MIYLDTSFVTPLFRAEAVSAAVERCLVRQPAGTLAISQWTRVEFSSVMARDVRMKSISARDASLVLEAFDSFVRDSLHVILPGAADFALADRFVRVFPAQLRAADALHLAIAHNRSADEVFTLDEGMLRAAHRLEIRAGRKIRLRS